MEKVDIGRAPPAAGITGGAKPTCDPLKLPPYIFMLLIIGGIIPYTLPVF